MPDDCKHACDLSQEIAELKGAIDDMRNDLKKAVPGGDHEGHRRYHELIIEREAQRVRLRQAIIEKTLGGLVWMGLCAVGLAIWHYFLSAVSRGQIR